MGFSAGDREYFGVLPPRARGCGVSEPGVGVRGVPPGSACEDLFESTEVNFPEVPRFVWRLGGAPFAPL